MEHAQQAHMWATLSPVGSAIGEVIETLRPHWRKWILGRGGETRPLGMYFIPGPFLYLSLYFLSTMRQTTLPPYPLPQYCSASPWTVGCNL